MATMNLKITNTTLYLANLMQTLCDKAGVPAPATPILVARRKR